MIVGNRALLFDINMNKFDKTYQSAHISDAFPHIGPVEAIWRYHDDILDNLMAMKVSAEDFTFSGQRNYHATLQLMMSLMLSIREDTISLGDAQEAASSIDGE